MNQQVLNNFICGRLYYIAYTCGLYGGCATQVNGVLIDHHGSDVAIVTENGLCILNYSNITLMVPIKLDLIQDDEFKSFANQFIVDVDNKKETQNKNKVETQNKRGGRQNEQTEFFF